VKCKICDDNLEEVISFGKMPSANGFLAEEEFGRECFFELACGFCPHCKAFQLLHHPDRNRMFHDQYVFYTSTSKVMSGHFERMARALIDLLPDEQNAFVVELGSNDGTMLKHFARRNIRHLGVEPSQNVAEVAEANGVRTKCRFFNESTAREILEEHGAADIISVANVHFADVHEMAAGIATLLKDDGIFVFENPYIGNVVENVAYDQIYDEHAFLFGLNSVNYIFSRHGLEVFHTEKQSTHGGSMRYYIGHNGRHPRRDSVSRQMHEENETLKLDTADTYRQFADRCRRRREELIDALGQLKREGKRVVGYGATAKSTTILNYCGIGPDLIECIYDTTPLKHNKYSPGMHIPIRAYTAEWWKNTDCAVLFAWNHSKEVLKKENAFVNNGGSWLFFTPQVRFENGIVGNN
jgi:methylation protein EvaC